jgi:hypothetical protein
MLCMAQLEGGITPIARHFLKLLLTLDETFSLEY